MPSRMAASRACVMPNVSATKGCKATRHRVIRIARGKALDLVAPPGECCLRHGGIADFVDDVVDLAAVGVDRGDRATPFRRQKQERVVEARAAAGGLLLAVLVGSHRALAASFERRCVCAAAARGARRDRASQAGSTVSVMCPVLAARRAAPRLLQGASATALAVRIRQVMTAQSQCAPAH